jgi:hypothetical protein
MDIATQRHELSLRLTRYDELVDFYGADSPQAWAYFEQYRLDPEFSERATRMRLTRRALHHAT